jgi:predicted transcriptional regulator
MKYCLPVVLSSVERDDAAAFLPKQLRCAYSLLHGEQRMANPASIFESEDKDAEERALLEAEADIAAGRLVPWEDVKRWLESWGTPNELPPPTCR